jgi:hypothetical protein
MSSRSSVASASGAFGGEFAPLGTYDDTRTGGSGSGTGSDQAKQIPPAMVLPALLPVASRHGLCKCGSGSAPGNATRPMSKVSPRELSPFLSFVSAPYSEPRNDKDRGESLRESLLGDFLGE